MSDVLIKNHRLVSISDEIRIMQDSSEKMNAAEIVENLKDVNTEINNQTVTIEDIMSALQKKLLTY